VRNAVDRRIQYYDEGLPKKNGFYNSTNEENDYKNSNRQFGSQMSLTNQNGNRTSFNKASFIGMKTAADFMNSNRITTRPRAPVSYIRTGRENTERRETMQRHPPRAYGSSLNSFPVVGRNLRDRPELSRRTYVPYGRLKKPLTMLDVDLKELESPSVSIKLLPCVLRKTEQPGLRVQVGKAARGNFKSLQHATKSLEDELENMFLNDDTPIFNVPKYTMDGSLDVSGSFTNFHRGTCFRNLLPDLFRMTNGLVKNIETPLHIHFRFGYLYVNTQDRKSRDLSLEDWISYDHQNMGNFNFLNGLSYRSISNLLAHFKQDEEKFWILLDDDVFEHCYLLFQNDTRDRRLSVDLMLDSKGKWRIKHSRNSEGIDSLRLTFCQGQVKTPDFRFYVHSRGHEVDYGRGHPLAKYVEPHLRSNGYYMIQDARDLPDESIFIRYRKKMTFAHQNFKITIDRQRSLFYTQVEADEKFDVKVTYLPWKRKLKKTPQHWASVSSSPSFRNEADEVLRFVRNLSSILKDGEAIEQIQ
jgi:hypothetical protein